LTIHWPESTVLRRPRTGTKKPKSGTKRTYPERAIQTAIVKALKKYAKPQYCFWYAIPNGGKRDVITAARLKAEGVQPGAPDLGFVLPFGLAAFLEIKASKGRQSVQQEFIEKQIEALGGRYAVAHSVDEAWGILAAWGVLPSQADTQTVLD
jgi:hypothetical protein